MPKWTQETTAKTFTWGVEQSTHHQAFTSWFLALGIIWLYPSFHLDRTLCSLWLEFILVIVSDCTGYIFQPSVHQVDSYFWLKRSCENLIWNTFENCFFFKFAMPQSAFQCGLFFSVYSKRILLYVMIKNIKNSNLTRLQNSG